MKNLIKKLPKVYLSLLVLVSILTTSSTNIFANSHNVGIRYMSGWTVHTVPSEGLYGDGSFLTVDGKPAWCFQANKPAQTGTNNEVSWTDIGLTDEQARVASAIAYFGYKSSGMTTDENYVLTQNLIWSYLGFGSYYTNTNYPTLESQQGWRNSVMSKVNTFFTNPDFGTTSVTVNVGQTITLADSSGVLSSMKVYANDGLNVSIQGNSLNITGTLNAPDSSTISLTPNIDESNLVTNFVVRSGNSQAISVCNLGDPSLFKIRVKVNKYIDVNVFKVDNELNEFEAQGNASLIGAEYSLYNSKDELVETKVFNETGKIRFEKLWASETYSIKETKAPQGYNISDEVFTINPANLLNSGQVGQDLQLYLTAKEKVMKQAFSMIKISSDGESTEVPTLAGSEWTVKLNSDIVNMGWDNAPIYDVLVTDEKGYAVSKELPFGTYTAKETKTPIDVETARDFTVIIDKDSREPQIYRVLNDAPFEAYLKLVKRDLDTGEVVTYSSASFQIFDDEGNLVVQKIGDKKIDTFTTNESGVVTTALKVSAGTYYIHEIKTPIGFVELDNPIEIKITNQGAVLIDDDGDAIIIVDVLNDQPKATIKLTKTFESSGHIEEKIAKFELQANRDIKSVIDGSTLYKKGQTINNPETDDGYYYVANGETLTIGNLPMGIGETSYVLKEIETAEGYVLSKNPIVYTFKQADETTKEYEFTNSVENKLIRTDIQVAKTDAYTKEIVMGIDGFIFEMDMTFTHGDVTVEAIQEQAIVNPKTGLATFKNIPYGATVSIKEIAVPEGEYYLSDEVKEIVVDKDIEGIGKVHTFTYENIPVEKIGTTAKDQLAGTNQGANREEVTIVDTVAYENLSLEKEYTLRGTLMDKETGEPLLLDGKEITSEVTFIPEKHNGKIDVVFTIPGTVLEGKTTVVFERLYTEDKEVAIHANIEDKGQTVYYPRVKTTALDKESGTHNAIGDKNITIIDTVYYENLIIGKEYEVSGVLMDKATNKPLLVDGKEITVTTTFVAEETTGSVELPFTFNATTLGKVTVVVFETLHQDGKEVAAHSDIEDATQTVDILPAEKPMVSTGDSTNMIMPILAIAVAAVIAGVILRHKMKDDNDGRK